MKRLLALICTCCGWLIAWSAQAQTPDSLPGAAPAVGAGGNGASTTSPPTLYRDPYTGQLYQQELHTVDVPVTNWQRKLVNRTVVTPQTVVENQQVPQTYYVAKTEYVLQTKLKGWWNPFAQPTYAYEYVPVTRWIPQTQMVTRQVPTVKMLAQTEQVPVDEPVQSTQKLTQVVMRPLPANAQPGGALPPNPQLANVQPANPQQQFTAPRLAASNAYANSLPPAQFRPASSVQPSYGYQNAYGRSNAQPLLASVPVLGRQPAQPASAYSAWCLIECADEWFAELGEGDDSAL